MMRIQLFGNTNPNYEIFLNEVNEHLEAHGIELVDYDTALPPVYLHLPWNRLLKLMVREYPEFKSDSKARKALKQQLWQHEQTLERFVEENEEAADILTISVNEFELPLQAAQVIAYKYKGVLI